jgi:hypothetical protein
VNEAASLKVLWGKVRSSYGCSSVWKDWHRVGTGVQIVLRSCGSESNVGGVDDTLEFAV